MRPIYQSTILVVLASFSCAPKVLVLQSPVVSMKATDSGASAAWGDARTVQEQWCVGDNPAHENDDGSKHYGMVDQVLWKAHAATKAPFFKDAKFYQQGTCVSMVAEAVSPAGASHSGSEPAATPDHATPKKPLGKKVKPKKG